MNIALNAPSQARKSRPPSGEEVLEALVDLGITDVVTVSDWVQLPLQRALDAQGGERVVATRKCSSEDEAFMMAAGLHVGGRRPVVVIQNQGLYAGLNALRGIGLDAKLPIMMMIGQFGREPDNFESSTRNSSRRIVSMLEPLLELLEIPFWKVATREDLVSIGTAIATSERDDWPTAVVFDLNMSWQ